MDDQRQSTPLPPSILALLGRSISVQPQQSIASALDLEKCQKLTQHKSEDCMRSHADVSLQPMDTICVRPTGDALDNAGFDSGTEGFHDHPGRELLTGAVLNELATSALELLQAEHLDALHHMDPSTISSRMLHDRHHGTYSAEPLQCSSPAQVERMCVLPALPTSNRIAAHPPLLSERGISTSSLSPVQQGTHVSNLSALQYGAGEVSPLIAQCGSASAQDSLGPIAASNSSNTECPDSCGAGPVLESILREAPACPAFSAADALMSQPTEAGVSAIAATDGAVRHTIGSSLTAGLPFDPRFQRGAPKTPPRKKCESCKALNPTARQYCVSCGGRFNIKQKTRDTSGRKRAGQSV